MIVLVIILISLCAIYFTRLLLRKRMQLATISVAALFICLVAWLYTVFIFDVANLGFSDTETRISLLTGSDIYHSFVSITDRMSVIPLELLEAIVAVAVIALCTGLAVAFHGLFEVTKAILTAVKRRSSLCFSESAEKIIRPFFDACKKPNIIKLHCRMNC